MALPKPSPGLLPAENYTRFGQAFNTIDLLAAQLPFAQQAIAALLDASNSHGTALTTLQQQGLSASQAIAALLDANAGYAQALTELQANDGAFDVLIGSLESLTDAHGKAITAEQSRATTAEALARIIAAPKYSVPLDTITLPNGGAVYWNGSTSTGAGETSGGLRVPQGQTGIFSQHRTRFQPTAAQRTKLAGRPVQFMVAFRSTVGALTALRDSAGFSTLGGVIEGVPSIVGVKIYSIRPDLWLAVGDAVLTGNENVITIALQVSGNTLPVAADVSFVAIGAMFMPVDATGTSDVLADFVQPLALRADNLIAAARVRYAPLLGAGPGVTDRVLVIPAGQSGAGSLAIYGAPVAGLQAGTRVRCRFAIQVAGGAFVSSGVAQSDPPVTLIELFGATVEMTDGSQVGAVAGLTATSPTTYEATVTFTATGAERIAEFYLKVDENSAVRLTEGQIRLGQMFVDVLSTEPTTTVAAQTARLTESFRAFIAAAPDRFRDWASASSLSDGDYGTIREAVAAMRTGGSQDQPNRVVVLPGTYTNECATGVSINPADYVEIVGKGARRDVEIIARLPDNQAAQDSQQPLYIQRSCRVASLTVRGRNVKYPSHLEAGNAPVAAIWDIDDCEFVHEGATGWTETSALGVGQNDGSKLTATGSTFLSPTSGVGIHNNTAWARGALATFTGCSLIGTGDSATSLAVTSQGAGVMSTVNLRGCVLSGRIHHYVSFLPGTPLSAYRGAPWEYTIRITDSDPVDWLSPCPFDVLTLSSVAAGNSAAAVGNTGAVRLFGRRPDVRAGAADYAARLHSGHLVSVPEGQFDPGVSLGARLSDMRGAAARPLDIFWDGNATPITITLDQNYTGMTNAQVLANLNGKLSAAMGGNTGGRAFSLSQPYHNRAPIRQPDREATAVNAGTATILKGHVLAKVGRRVRLMTSTDAGSLFAGIALDDAVPGRSVRFLKTGLIGQAHLLFDGDQTFTVGARYQISATNPGRLVPGTDLPVLSVRSVEAYGAALEIIGTVAFTGSATEAVRDAFAGITYRDVPGLPAVVDTLASKGANSDITSLTGLTTPLSQAQGGTGVPWKGAQDFGVRGDGFVDDTNALNAYLLYCAAHNLDWFIPYGMTCLVSGPVTAYTSGKCGGVILCANNGQTWFPFNVAPLVGDVTTISPATLNAWTGIVKDSAFSSNFARYYGCTVWWYTSDEKIINRNGAPSDLNYADCIVIEDPSGNFYPPILKTKSTAWANVSAQAIRNREMITIDGVTVRFTSGTTESTGGIQVTRPNTLLLRPNVVNISAAPVRQLIDITRCSGVQVESGYVEGAQRNTTNYGYTTGISVGTTLVGCREIYCRRGFDTTQGKDVSIQGGSYPDGVGGHWCAGLDVGGGAFLASSSANTASSSPNTAPIWVAGREVAVHNCKIFLRSDQFTVLGVRGDLFELAGAARLTDNDITIDCTANLSARRYLFSAATTAGSFDFGRSVQMPALIDVSGNRVRQIGASWTEYLSAVSLLATGTFASPSGMSAGGHIKVGRNSWNFDAGSLNGTQPRIRVDLLKYDAWTAGLGTDNVGYTIDVDDVPHVSIYLYCSPTHPTPSAFRSAVRARTTGTFGWGANYGAFSSLRASFSNRTSAWTSSRPGGGYGTAIGDEMETRDDVIEWTGTWNPSSMTSLHAASTPTPNAGHIGVFTATVPGANVGDAVFASLSSIPPSPSSVVAWTLTGTVTSPNTVTVVITNLNAGTVDLGSGTLHIRVHRQ